MTLYLWRLFTCVITFFVKRGINKINSVIFGVKTDAGDGRNHNCHAKGNRSKKHDDMVGLRNFKNRKFIIIKTLIERAFWVKNHVFLTPYLRSSSSSTSCSSSDGSWRRWFSVLDNKSKICFISNQ